MHKKHILIVGGGFGGVKAALELSRDNRLSVSILTSKPFFRYYPTLYHTATGGLERQSSIPLTSILEESNIKILIGDAKTVDKEEHTVKTTEGDVYHYDFLILALGVVTNYFGIKGLEEYSYGIKSIEEADELKHHLHQQLVDDRQPDLNYIIVGGGATGIELAGAMTAYLKTMLKRHSIRHRAVHIDLVEASPKLMPRMPAETSKAIAKRLRSLGIKLYLGQTVQGESADSLMVNGKPITSHTVIWTAGVTNHPFFKENGFELTDRGKVNVDPYLQAAPDIFVLGDNANTPFSGMAQTALHDALFVSRNLIRHIDKLAPRVYKPKKPIYITPAGPYWAAVLWGNMQFYGRTGWVLRELADFVAFHDLEPWWRAGAQWMTEFDDQEECPICATASS